MDLVDEVDDVDDVDMPTFLEGPPSPLRPQNPGPKHDFSLLGSLCNSS